MRTQALLPLITYPDANSAVVATNAAAMAAVLNASLHALAINVDIPVATNALSRLLLNVPEMVRLAEETSRERSVRLLAVVEREAEQWGVEVTTATIAPNVAFLGEAAAVHARYFDYVLCGWEAGNPTSASTAEALIFGSGRPTILLPELSQVSIMDHLAIAWDGSRVAARAAFDAQHLLRLSGKVSVLTVVGEKPLDDADSAQRLARVLEQKGVAAEAVSVEFGGSSIATLIQARAVELGANLLVMGAFGHSRTRDFMLGGATQGILADLQLPVLLSH